MACVEYYYFQAIALDGFLDDGSDFSEKSEIDKISWIIEHVLSGIDSLSNNAYTSFIGEDFVQDFISSFQLNLGSTLKSNCDDDQVRLLVIAVQSVIRFDYKCIQ